MKHRARIFICASYIGFIDCDHYELKDHPFRLIFYNHDGSVAGHVEPKDGLIARVQIYFTDQETAIKEIFTIGTEYVFRNNGPVVLSEYESGKRKEVRMIGEGVDDEV